MRACILLVIFFLSLCLSVLCVIITVHGSWIDITENLLLLRNNRFGYWFKIIHYEQIPVAATVVTTMKNFDKSQTHTDTHTRIDGKNEWVLYKCDKNRDAFILFYIIAFSFIILIFHLCYASDHNPHTYTFIRAQFLIHSRSQSLFWMMNTQNELTKQRDRERENNASGYYICLNWILPQLHKNVVLLFNAWTFLLFGCTVILYVCSFLLFAHLHSHTTPFHFLFFFFLMLLDNEHI